MFQPMFQMSANHGFREGSGPKRFFLANLKNREDSDFRESVGETVRESGDGESLSRLPDLFQPKIFLSRFGSAVENHFSDRNYRDDHQPRRRFSHDGNPWEAPMKQSLPVAVPVP